MAYLKGIGFMDAARVTENGCWPRTYFIIGAISIPFSKSAARPKARAMNIKEGQASRLHSNPFQVRLAAVSAAQRCPARLVLAVSTQKEGSAPAPGAVTGALASHVGGRPNGLTVQ